MKKLLIILLCFLLIGCNKEITISPLEDKYYGKNEIIELNIETFNKLIENKETFGVLLYQPMCAASSNFENVIDEFSKKQQITLYKLQFNEMKKTKLSKEIEYCPSFAIFHNGKIIDFLDANSDDDVDYYLSLEGFEKWFKTYIELRTPEKIEEEIVDDTKNNVESNNKFEIEIEYLTYDENKINIYLFYGDGCEFCEHELEYFKSIKEEYGEYFKLNIFEVWHNDHNKKIYEEFLKVTGDEDNGVPYTVIGDVTFVGYGTKNNDEFLEIIKTQHKNSFDVYFNNK